MEDIMDMDGVIRVITDMDTLDTAVMDLGMVVDTVTGLVLDTVMKDMEEVVDIIPQGLLMLQMADIETRHMV